jgi:hypothetical protein
VTLLRNRSDLATLARLSAVRWTHLQHMLESPAHYLDSFDTPNDDTPEKRIGRTVDAYVLGGEQPLIFAGKRQGEAWERFLHFHSGRDILSVSENDAAKYAADAIESNRHAMSVLEGGASHPEIQWSYRSRQCVSHPDYVGRSFISSLKVSNTVHPEWFMRAARRKGYPVQLAMESDAVRSSGMATPADHFIVAASYKRPFAVTVLRMTNMEAASERLALLFSQLAICEKTDQWPGYTDGVVDFAADGAVAEVEAIG